MKTSSIALLWLQLEIKSYVLWVDTKPNIIFTFIKDCQYVDMLVQGVYLMKGMSFNVVYSLMAMCVVHG